MQKGLLGFRCRLIKIYEIQLFESQKQDLGEYLKNCFLYIEFLKARAVFKINIIVSRVEKMFNLKKYAIR